MNWENILDILGRKLFTLGKTDVSLTTILAFVGVVVGVILLSRLTRRALSGRILKRTKMDAGLQYMISRVAGYIVLVLGLMIGFQTMGIDLSSLTVLAGALGIGIGFGLQTIVSNFVSGLILMAERSVQIGDRVDVGGTMGRVIRIGARSTIVETNDNIAIIVPNSEFVSGRVVNWSLRGDQRIRLHVPVGVSYGSDPRQVEKLLLEIAAADPHVLKEPAPRVVFREFGDSSLNFDLRVWTADMTNNPGAFKSNLYFAIWEAFKQHDIEIPFPQRDLHVKQPLQVEIKQPPP